MKKGLALREAKGFTLIELLVVIAIIGILASVVVVNLGSTKKKAKRVSLASNSSQIITAWGMYSDDKGLEGSGALFQDIINTPSNSYINGKLGTLNAVSATVDGPISFVLKDSSGNCSITVTNSNVPSATNSDPDNSDFSGSACE